MTIEGNKSEPNYIDDVSRNYFVYLHKDKKSNTPFYVGKGTDKRAYSRERSPCWQQKVNSLNGEYTVEIVKDKLSESEAYEFECELIKKYGCEWNNTGTLVNQTKGGDIFSGDGMTIKFSVDYRDVFRKYLEKNEKSFKSLPIEKQEGCIDILVAKMNEEPYIKNLNKEEQNNFVDELTPKLKQFSKRYKKVIGVLDYERDKRETSLEGSIDDFLTTFPKAINKYRKRKISFKNLAICFQDYLWGIKSDLEDTNRDNEKEDVILLAIDMLSFLNPLLDYLTKQDEPTD